MLQPAAAGKKRILVTGATGYIGFSFLKHICSHHADTLIPVALARPTSDIIHLQRLLDYQSPTPSVYVSDMHDPVGLKASLQNVDIVLHLAANMDFYPRDPEALYDTNVTCTHLLMEACNTYSASRKSPLRFVYVSSTEVIGCTDGLSRASEQAERHPTTDYARSKLKAEDLVSQFQKFSHIDAVIVRPTGVFGPGERFFFFEFMNMAASGLSLIAPSPMTGRVIFTHIDDVIAGLLICCTHPQAVSQTFNLCADQSVTYRAILELCADVLKYPRPLVFLSQRTGRFLMSFIAPFMNIGKRRVFMYHRDSVEKSMQFREYDNSKLRALGFCPKYSMLAGVERTLKYEIETGAIQSGFIPSALKRCLHVASLITFSISRMVRGRARTDQA